MATCTGVRELTEEEMALISGGLSLGEFWRYTGGGLAKPLVPASHTWT